MEVDYYPCVSETSDCWDWRLKVALAGWPRHANIEIEYTFYKDGNQIDSDTDWCYDTTGCIKYSKERTYVQAKRDTTSHTFCIRAIAYYRVSSTEYVHDKVRRCFTIHDYTVRLTHPHAMPRVAA
jgi:hypothetical protein